MNRKEYDEIALRVDQAIKDSEEEEIFMGDFSRATDLG
jgi:hypothetical protein